jgi:hypothetical protein
MWLKLLERKRTILPRPTITVVSVLCLLFSIAPGAAYAAQTPTAPAKVQISKLFAAGADLCKVIKTSAVSKAVGIKFAASVPKKFTCFWQSGKTVVRISALPGLGKPNVEGTVALARKSSATVTKLTKASLPAVNEAYVVRILLGTSVSESVYGVLPQGELLVSLSGPGLVGSQAVAVAKAALS